MLATVPSAVLRGVTGHPVRVEVHVSGGFPGFTVVGLPDASCRESRDRVRAALLSSGLTWPQTRVTVNLAPSGVPKAGAGLDLAIALGLVAAAGALEPSAVARVGCIAELGLDGSLRPVAGTLPLVDAVEADTVIVAPESLEEAAAVGGLRVGAAETFGDVVQWAAGRGEELRRPRRRRQATSWTPRGPDLADVRGQPFARLALEVAAAGGHHVLLVGPPGAGKTMLAERLPGLLPPLTPDVALDVTRIHSAAGLPLPPGGLVTRPPFRAPHHGASMASLVGGGSGVPRPGEISCSDGGVLFLDELGEFAPSVLDALRQPLESGQVRVARADGTAVFPARFLLVAAMNPCPCGFAAEPGRCRCSEAARLRYSRRVSGPLLDRFDLRVPVARPNVADLIGGVGGESSADVARRVAAARTAAVDRGVLANASLDGPAIERHAPLSPPATALLEAAIEAQRLSARGLNRVRAVALTLADLAGHDGALGEEHVAQALQLRIDPLALDPSEVLHGVA